MTRLNTQSLRLIDDVWINAKHHPMYSSYEIVIDKVTYADGGAIAIIIGCNSQVSNMFLFYPTCDDSGKIGSVAIYGNQLPEHKRVIEQSMQIFGFPVKSIAWDEGREKFLDISLCGY